MEKLLRGRDPAVVVPFSLESPILLFPVRHHSPVCSWHLEQVMERYHPELVLVEGPENACHLLPVLSDPATEAPVALYYSFRNSDGESEEIHSCYYPFLDTSPELVAARKAASMGIPCRFIDLSYGDILLASDTGCGLRSSSDPMNYSGEKYLSPDLLWNRVCERTGTRDFEEFWEKYYETAGFFMSDAEFVRQMNGWCLLARENTPAGQLEQDGTLAREAHMAAKIQEASETASRILVVAGGFHLWGLLHPQKVFDRPSAPADAQAVYPVRYSEPETEALNGYASGMPSPAFRRELWGRLHRNNTTVKAAWRDTLLHYIIRCGRTLRSGGGLVTAFDERCALEEAEGLALLRGKAVPGLYELRDSILNCFVKGEALPDGGPPLQVLRDDLTGDKAGRLCRDDLVPPLVRDFDEQCGIYRLSKSAAAREKTLELFSKPRHREESRFFHRCVFLNLKFADRISGPDPVSQTGQNLIREKWQYRWSGTVEAALVEASAFGATLKGACKSLFLRELNDAQDAATGARLLYENLLMGLEEPSGDSLQRLRQLILADGDFSSLCHACFLFCSMEDRKAQYLEAGRSVHSELLELCFSCTLRCLPYLKYIDDRSLSGAQEACLRLYQISGKEPYAAFREALKDALRKLIACHPIHPGIHGTVLGLLYGSDPALRRQIPSIVRGYLEGSREMKLKAAAFLQGLFFTARDLLLTDSIRFTEIDSLLCELSDEDFMTILPYLRLAFSYFTPTETERLGRTAAALHGASVLRTQEPGITPALYALLERIDASAAEELGIQEVSLP